MREAVRAPPVAPRLARGTRRDTRDATQALEDARSHDRLLVLESGQQDVHGARILAKGEPLHGGCARAPSGRGQGGAQPAQSLGLVLPPEGAQGSLPRDPVVGVVVPGEQRARNHRAARVAEHREHPSLDVRRLRLDLRQVPRQRVLLLRAFERADEARRGDIQVVEQQFLAGRPCDTRARGCDALRASRRPDRGARASGRSDRADRDSCARARRGAVRAPPGALSRRRGSCRRGPWPADASGLRTLAACAACAWMAWSQRPMASWTG